MIDATAIGLRESVVSPEAHRLFRDLIDQILATGAIRQVERSDLVRELSGQDWIVANDDVVTAVYPFALEPSAIQTIIDGQTRYAMCAIDALGIAPMLSVPVEIRKACPETGAPLALWVDDRVATTPPGVVVVRRRQAGSAHLSRCAATRFFASEVAAEHWRDRAGNDRDLILSPEHALAEATLIFGRCYTDGVRMVI